MNWPATKAKRVFAALLRLGWSVKRRVGGSHVRLHRPGWPDYTWAWHDDVEIGRGAMKRIGVATGLTPDDL